MLQLLNCGCFVRFCAAAAVAVVVSEVFVGQECNFDCFIIFVSGSCGVLGLLFILKSKINLITNKISKLCAVGKFITSAAITGSLCECVSG